MTGVSVAVLDLDGIDTEPVVSRLIQALDSRGFDSRRVSWPRYLAESGAEPGYPAVDLDAYWVDLYRVLYAGATRNGRPVELPTGFHDSAEKDLFAGLDGTRTVSGMGPTSPVAAAWIALAAETTLRHGVVDPLLEKGLVVVQESLGVKNLLKILHLAEHLDPGPGPAIAGMRDFVQLYAGSTLASDVGVFLDADPAGLLDRNGGRGFGGERAETYLRLQTACRADFGHFARAHGWLTIPCGGDLAPDALDELVERVVSAASAAS